MGWMGGIALALAAPPDQAVDEAILATSSNALEVLAPLNLVVLTRSPQRAP